MSHRDTIVNQSLKDKKISGYFKKLEEAFNINSNYEKQLLFEAKSLYESFTSKAQTPEEFAVINRIFRRVNIKNTVFYFINDIKHFSNNELQILNKIGLKASFKGVKPPQDNNRYAVEIYDADFVKLMRNVKDISFIVKNLFRASSKELFEKEFEPYKNELIECVKDIVSSGVKQFEDPKDNKVFEYPGITINGLRSVLTYNNTSDEIITFFESENNNGIDFDILSNSHKRVAELQKNGTVPSILNPKSYKRLRKYKQIIIVLLDVSSSTLDYNIYRYICLSVEQIRRFIYGIKINTDIVIAPYDDTVRGYFKLINSFELPDGGTDYCVAFNDALSFFQKNVGYDNRILVNISDGIPNDLDKALKVASLFPQKNISYNQIIFGHGLEQISESLIADRLVSLGADKSYVTNMKQYEQSFSDIAISAKGNQVLVWVTEKMAQATIGSIDLCIGDFFRTKNLLK